MLEYLLAFSILKAPIGFKLFLNIIPILLGLVFFLKTRRVNKLFLPMIILLSLGALRSISLLDYQGVVRLGQVFCLLAFASMAKNWVNEESLHRLARGLFYFGALVLAYEIAFVGPVHIKDLFGHTLNRYGGPVGESNYSALVLAFTSLIFIMRKDWLHFAGSLVSIYFCVSRTGFIMVLIFILFLLLHKILKEYIQWPLRILAVLLCATPFLIWMAYKFVPLEYLQTLERLSSGRIFLFIPYVDMGFDQIVGVGYFNGWDRYEEYLQRFMHIDTGRNRQINEQHNIFIQVFSEFGVLLYPLWCWQVLKVYWQENKDLLPLILFTTLLIAFSLLNGMNEFILYIAYAWVIAKNKISNDNLMELFHVKGR